MKPTEENEEIEQEGELMQKEYEFIPRGLCQYRQQGPYLVCKSCELQHAQFIGMDKQMIGEDDMGQPIIKPR